WSRPRGRPEEPTTESRPMRRGERAGSFPLVTLLSHAVGREARLLLQLGAVDIGERAGRIDVEAPRGGIGVERGCDRAHGVQALHHLAVGLFLASLLVLVSLLVARVGLRPRLLRAGGERQRHDERGSIPYGHFTLVYALALRARRSRPPRLRRTGAVARATA